ncbi:MAG: hypothetical protein P8100_11880 [bacterium]|jgi:hypothetical protein
MIDRIHNITRWILYVLVAVVAILGVLFYTDNLSSEGIITGAKYMLYLGIAVMIISPIYSFISNPTNIVKLLISIGLMVVVIVIGYSMADNTFTPLELETLETTADTSKLVGMGLYVTYIAFGLTILVTIYASIIKAFK